MMETTLGFIGGGRIARILLEGFSKKGMSFRRILASDVNAEVFKTLKGTFPSVETSLGDNHPPASADIVFLALHPPVLPAVLGEIRSSLNPNGVLVSLAPKISMDKISEILGGFKRIVRMIPNAPSIVNAGYNPVAFGDGLGDAEKKELLKLFSALGECPVVKEETLEAYAVLAAMGPTYFWFQWEELENLGAAFGLEREASRRALSAMIEGAERAYFRSGYAGKEIMDLIPVKPLQDDEEEIRSRFRQRLEPLYNKIKP